MTLRVYDDASRATEAARATHRLIAEDGVALLMGPYSSALTRLATLQADLILVAGSFEQDVRLARAIAMSRPENGIVALVAAGVDAFGAQLGAEATEFYGPSQWEPNTPVPVDVGPAADTVAARLRTALAGPADYPAAQAYAAGLVAQQCLERAGSDNPRGLRRAARQLDIRTFYGQFRIDDAGRQVGHEVTIVRWRNGIKEIVSPSASSSTR